MAETAAQVKTARKRIKGWRADPVQFVRDNFNVEPDLWQAEALRSMVDHRRVVLSACKGPGKSCAEAWFIWWCLSLHVGAQGIAVSITADNLKDNLWKECAYWRDKCEWIKRSFEINAERIFSVESPKTWWCSARSFPQQADKTQQANTLAGLHAPFVFIVLDESGDMPVGVLAAAEGIFAVKGQDARILTGGNPTTTNGALHAAATSKSWHVIHITGDPDDKKRSPRIDIKWAREQIERWGRDNPWVMVNVLGQFPPAAANQLIGIDVVMAAQERVIPALKKLTDSKIWGFDPAREGDDEAALYGRQGVLASLIDSWRGLDGTALGDAVGRHLLEAEENDDLPDQMFVDVGGQGASAYDRLKHLGWQDLVQPVDFGGKAEGSEFLNKRAEIWWRMAEWLKKMPACIPNEPVIKSELVAPTFKFSETGRQTKLQLEKKADMKKRGVPSPNRADALALTFTAPVMPKGAYLRARAAASSRNAKCETDYNPMDF